MELEVWWLHIGPSPVEGVWRSYNTLSMYINRDLFHIKLIMSVSRVPLMHDYHKLHVHVLLYKPHL